MFHRILVPLDGSRHAELAVPAAVRLVLASGGSIVFAHIVPAIESDQKIEVTMTQDTRLIAHADTYLHAVEQKYADELQNTHVETDIVEVDSVSTGILTATRLEHVDLIVMCLQGETFLNHWLFRHIPRHAIRRSSVPVLVLNEQGKLLDAPDVAHPFHVLIPLDGSAEAEAVLDPIAQLLTTLALREQQVIIQFLDIIDAPHMKGYERTRDEAVAYLKTVTERIQREWRIKPTVISSILLNSEVSETILYQAERVADAHAPAGCDLIAMGTHGRDGVQSLVHGSVTEHVLGSTRFPLFVVTSALSHQHALPTA